MRLMAYQEGRWSQHSDRDRAAARELILGPTPVWVRAGDGPDDQLDDLAAWLDLHPLCIEDLRNPRQRPKVEDYADLTFMVLRLPRPQPDGVLAWQQVGLFLGAGFLVTASETPVPELDAVQERLTSGRLATDGRADRLLYHVVDAIVDAYFPFLEQIEDDLEAAADAALDEANPETLQAVRGLRLLLARTRRVVPPMRDAVVSLERGTHPNLQHDLDIYLRDVSDHAIRIAERVDHLRELSAHAQDSWNATLANNQNQVMKRLTVVAALLLLPSLMAGLGGMNFTDGFPDWPFWPVAVTIVGIASTGVVVAAWRRWL